MSLFMRDSLGRLIPVNPGLPADRGNQGGMGRRLSEAELMSTLPDADIAGAIGPGVVPGGEQSLGARRLKLEAAEGANPPAPTYRPLGGAQQNNRGNARLVTLTRSIGQNTILVPSVVETSKNSGDDAEALSVQLAMELPDEFTSPVGAAADCPFEVVCLLEWGVGGAFFSAECDWNQGVSFSVCASFLRVSARVTYGDSIFGLNLDVPIVLKASIAYGNADSLNVSSSARRTLPMSKTGNVSPFILAPGDVSDIIPIPLWAMGFTLMDGSFVSPSYRIELFQGAGGASAEVVYTWVDRSNNGEQVEGQFPVPGRSRFIRITNLSGSNSNKPKLVFNLGF